MKNEWMPCAATASDVVLVVHGGAGTILRENLTPDLETQLQNALADALRAGYAVLTDGKTATDAVEASVRVLEDNPLFNAGRGAVFTADGRNELDAAIMDGKTGMAGAVAGATVPRNPVTLARAVMEKTPFVFLAGAGADELCADLGLPVADADYFHTDIRHKQHHDQLRRAVDGDVFVTSLSEDNKFGTVGAVAVDAGGFVSAATSTGGMTNKRYGRVGDSPVIGAGTWADKTCAVSATGHGEYFLRLGIAHDVAARIRYTGASLAVAANAAIHERLQNAGGDGGIIALDPQGNAALVFNTAGMYRGYITRTGKLSISIYETETSAADTDGCARQSP